MSNLATADRLRRATSQLPVSWYCDPAVLDIEKRLLFERGPGYVGHELMVPNPGDYYALAWRDNAQVLVRNAAGLELLSNICRHRQAIMLNGRGNATSIVCPIHRWTYNLKGELLGAPHFAEQPCTKLDSAPLKNWHGLLFDGPRDIKSDLAALGVAHDFDFSGYMLDRVEVKDLAYNWKTFIEVYLEDYHVAPFHPGLGHFVTCDDLKWQYGDWFSVQTVGVNLALGKPGSDVYRMWHEQVLKYRNGEPPPHGAIWLTYFPNVMVEWYPHVLVVSTLYPRGPEKCLNVIEFYYPEEIALFEPEFMEAQQKAYHETAIEDEEICVRMTEGRRALLQDGREEHGPYQSPMEDGMVHFHEFLRREIGQHV